MLICEPRKIVSNVDRMAYEHLVSAGIIHPNRAGRPRGGLFAENPDPRRSIKVAKCNASSCSFCLGGGFMRVLFVDDEQWRFDSMVKWGIIPSDTVCVDSATDAIEAIVDLGPFHAIFLDHDLNTFVQDPHPREITGNDVARTLCEVGWRPDTVVVHSSNPSGAMRIAATLRDGGMSPIVKPITSFADDAYRKNHADL